MNNITNNFFSENNITKFIMNNKYIRILKNISNNTDKIYIKDNEKNNSDNDIHKFAPMEK